MSKQFEPNYHNIEKAARNSTPERLPLYEHIICDQIMESVLNKKFSDLIHGDFRDKVEYFKNYCNFFKTMGYDTVSYEQCIGSAMPGSGALGGHVDPAIKTRPDFDRYPWDEVPELYYQMTAENFRALGEAMPVGMKAIGGVGNGIFECVQDVVGYMDLCYISADDPELYEDLFNTVGRTNLKIWNRFLQEFGDHYCVVRFGDDLGYKLNTMIAPDDIKKLVIPQYKKIVDAAHNYGKPFLLHSCGCIWDVMDDLITVAGIDAKHSNEDQIAKFPVWVEKYGHRIGNFGGIDTDAVCRLTRNEMKTYIHDVIEQCQGHGGFAFGSGNSIPDYVPLEGYLAMVEIVREYRGDYT